MNTPLDKEHLWKQANKNGVELFKKWSGDWGRKRVPPRDHRLTVVVPDGQTPWIDKEAFYAVLHYIYVNQPEAIIQIGDWFDLYSLSKFKKKIRPNRRIYLDDELYGHWGGDDDDTDDAGGV